MPVQSNGRGYDKSQTVTEQIAATQATLATALANGRDGTANVQALRQRIADLQAGQVAHVATQTRARTTLAAHAATNAMGTVRPDYGKADVIE